MLKKTVQGLIVLTAVLLSTGAAPARDLVKDLQLDVFGMAGASTDIDSRYFESAGRLMISQFNLGPKFTVGVGVPYGKLLSFETSYTWGPNNWVVTNDNVFPHAPVVYAVRDSFGSFSALVHSPRSFMKVVPYMEGGVEYDHFSPTPAAIGLAHNQGFAAVSTAIITRNDKFGVNVGGGLDRKIMKRLTFRIDLRDHITNTPNFGLPQQPNVNSAAAFPVKGKDNNIQYTAGFIFHLGKL